MEEHRKILPLGLEEKSENRTLRESRNKGLIRNALATRNKLCSSLFPIRRSFGLRFEALKLWWLWSFGGERREKEGENRLENALGMTQNRFWVPLYTSPRKRTIMPLIRTQNSPKTNLISI